MKMTNSGLAALLWAVWGVSLAAAESPPGGTPVTVNIESQPMEAALNAFATQTGLQLLFHVEEIITPGMKADRVVGTLPAAAALKQLLNDSGLRYEFINARTVAIRAADERISVKMETPENQNKLRLAQAGGSDTGGEEPPPASTKEETQGEKLKIEEVVVTGTHLRGVAPVGSPLKVFTREDIERSGLQTTQDFLDTIPQNFGGGASIDTNASFIPGRNQSLNTGLGTGINLRGLGADATLVLLNGHRLTQTAAGNFVDVSQVPLAAIDRVDVLSDGASAIYGSDAVAGVVNLILRDRFQGVELRANAGTVTSGGSNRAAAGGTFGGDWTSGRIVASYDFQHQTSLNRDDRLFAQNPVGDLLPALDQHQILLNGRQDFGQSAVFFDALYSHRADESSLFVLPTTVPNDQRRATSEAYGASLRSTIPLPNFFDLSVSTAYSEAVVNDADAAIFPDSASNITTATEYESKLFSIGGNVSRDLFALKGGKASGIVGIDYRHESFNGAFTFNGEPFPYFSPKQRDIRSLFAEILAPLIGPENTVSSVYRFEVSAALRHEEYSDSGSTTNPKFGILWQPVPDLKLRASYGSSFRAPSFDQEDVSGNATVLIDVPDPDPSNQTLALLLFGNKPVLEPEKSRTYSFGVDYTPTWQTGLTTVINYFNTRFKDRIASPSNLPFEILSKENIFAPLITRNPTAEQIEAAIAATPQFFDESGGQDSSEARVIIDNFTQNIGITNVDGVDLDVNQSFSWAGIHWMLGLNATRLFHFENQVTQAAPKDETLATLFNPPKTRVRASVAWNANRFRGGMFANYVPSYEDSFSATPTRISDWLTFDFSISCAILKNTSLTLAAQDIFNSAPPHVDYSALAASQFLQPVGYDPANASPLRRFVSLAVRTSF